MRLYAGKRAPNLDCNRDFRRRERSIERSNAASSAASALSPHRTLRASSRLKFSPARSLGFFLAALIFLLAGTSNSWAAGNKEKLTYGEPLIVNIPVSEAEVEQVVAEVAGNGLIRGTKEYNKDEFVSGAQAADSCDVFPPWTEGGKVFYKVRLQAIDPRNFKDSADVGTLAVRYVLQPQGAKNTVLRIDALFEEDFRHTVHPSSGLVESAEYKDIREHLDSIELMKRQTVEAEQERQEYLAKKQRLATQGNAENGSPSSMPGDSSSQPLETGDSSSRVVEVTPTAREDEPPPSAVPQTLEEKVKSLRKQVERVVKAPGAPLKSAPFHTASTLQLMATGTEVLILINTPYWYGVETHEGQHGWMMRDELEEP